MSNVAEHVEVTGPATFKVAAPKLDRAAIRAILGTGKRLLVQGGMGIHASDGLAGKVAAIRSRRFVGVGTISAVIKTPEHLRAEIQRAKAVAPGGYVGINLMAAINKGDFELSARTALDEGVSFIVQGAGISRDIVRWCREAGTPFAGIVSSGRLAAMYEKWGAEWVVAEGAEAGGHIGDIDHPLPSLVEEVCAATSLPVVAAGGVDASDVGRYFAQGAAGVQLATRFIASSDGDAHETFKKVHLGKTAEDVAIITSCVKGMKARAVRSPFTEALAAGKTFPPRSKAWYFGPSGYMGRKKACIECLAENLCKCRASNFQESFCITDALLRAVALGDEVLGLYYTGQSLVRLPETQVGQLRTVQAIVDDMDTALDAYEGAGQATPVPPSPQ
jgi:NAD(P)H-dependent flavin oxidoreductase YrpB (nitropropane dioxygenase family)